MKDTYTDHDRLFKELIQTFFAEFMQLFFPEASRSIDFKHLKFLQQEVYTDIVAGEKHVVDILVETRLREEPGMIMVHIEPQAYVQKDFNERMFIYFSRLYEKYRCRILPVAVFSYDQKRNEPDNFTLQFPFLSVMQFRYYKIELKKLDWREYIKGSNPVAAALLSKMGFSSAERVKVKLEFMRMLARMKLDPARMEFLGGFFESYLKLNSEEEAELELEMNTVDRKEAEAIMQITTSWHEKGREKGKIEGEKEGRRETAKAALKKGLPADLVAEITGLTQEAVLKLKNEQN